jgi:hypothetical protein
MRVLEPSCGTGAFISAVNQCIGLIDAEVTGVELDAAFANVAQDIWGDRTKIINDDFLLWAANPESKFDFLVANPPYVRHHHLSQIQKASYARVAGKSSGFSPSGLAGLYVYFILGSTHCLANGAVATWLIPSEFMSVNYGSTLRNFLTDRVTLGRVHIFRADDLQFDDAQVTSCVVTYTNHRPTANHEVLFTFGSSLTAPDRTESISLVQLQGSPKWLKCFEANSDETDVTTVGDLFNIRRGIATGANDFFIRPRNEFCALGISADYLKPILPSPRNMPLSEVAVDDRGWPISTGSHALLDCTGYSERNLPGPVLAYLNSAPERVRSSYLVRGRTPWYAQEQRPTAPILCTYMGRISGKSNNAFRFIRNRSLATATNSYLMLFLRPEIANSVTQEWIDDIWHSLSSLATKTIVSEGREYGGGLKKIEPKELARVPLPGVNSPAKELALF